MRNLWFRNKEKNLRKWKLFLGYGHIQWVRSICIKSVVSKTKDDRMRQIYEKREDIRKIIRDIESAELINLVYVYTMENNWAEYQRRRTLQKTTLKKTYGITISLLHCKFFIHQERFFYF